jgi:hypothetical protein
VASHGGVLEAAGVALVPVLDAGPSNAAVLVCTPPHPTQTLDVSPARDVSRASASPAIVEGVDAKRAPPSFVRVRSSTHSSNGRRSTLDSSDKASPTIAPPLASGSRHVSYMTSTAWPPTMQQLEDQEHQLSLRRLRRNVRTFGGSAHSPGHSGRDLTSSPSVQTAAALSPFTPNLLRADNVSDEDGTPKPITITVPAARRKSLGPPPAAAMPALHAPAGAGAAPLILTAGSDASSMSSLGAMPSPQFMPPPRLVLHLPPSTDSSPGRLVMPASAPVSLPSQQHTEPSQLPATAGAAASAVDNTPGVPHEDQRLRTGVLSTAGGSLRPTAATQFQRRHVSRRIVGGMFLMVVPALTLLLVVFLHELC